MATSVQMPALGESVTEGTVTRWLKQEGDTVEMDEPLLEVSTDKVDTEIPSPAAGVLKKIVAQEDDTVEVGGELAVIGDAGEDDGGGEEPKSEEPAEEQKPRSPPRRRSLPRSPPRNPSPPPRKRGTRGRGEPEPEEKPAASSGGGDATPVLMPELGESVTEGTVTRWLKKVGDSVEVDEPLVEVSTDKVDTEIPSPVAGTLVSITAEEDDTVAVGGELAKIGDAGCGARRKARTQAGTQRGTERGAQGRGRRRSPNPSRSRNRSPSPRKRPSRSRSPNRKRSRRKRPRRHRRPIRSRRVTARRT